MQITTGKIVSIDYTLTNDNADTLDTSEGRGPLAYLHGKGQLISGLEKALEGKSAGDALQVQVEPEEGYGPRDEAKTGKVPKTSLQGVENVREGMQLRASGPQGEQIVTVAKVEEDSVTLDANHPLAGVNLNFDVTVREVRDATEEELTHGHAHGPGGHQH